MNEPLMAVSSGIPDWLSVVDRKIRARRRMAIQFIDHEDAELRSVARGIVAHVDDDRWFHSGDAFVQTNLQFAVELRDLLPGDAGFRPTFVGHILVEMLLDALWIRDSPEIAKRSRTSSAAIPATTIQRCVNMITGRPTDGLAPVIERYVDARFLYDYLDETTLLFRLNQVMKRVGLTPLPDTIKPWLNRAFEVVGSRRLALLTPAGQPFPFPPFETK